MQQNSSPLNDFRQIPWQIYAFSIVMTIIIVYLLHKYVIYPPGSEGYIEELKSKRGEKLRQRMGYTKLPTSDEEAGKKMMSSSASSLLGGIDSTTNEVLTYNHMLAPKALSDKNSNEYQEFKLSEKIILNKDTRIFRFALHHKNQVLGLPTGKHIFIKALIPDAETGEEEVVLRAYTPITNDSDYLYETNEYEKLIEDPEAAVITRALIKEDEEGTILKSNESFNQRRIREQSKAKGEKETKKTGIKVSKGFFDLVIKVYFKDQNTKFPYGGKLTQYLEGLLIGDSIKVRGPCGLFEYKTDGDYIISKGKEKLTEHHVDFIGMIAGGSGITPMFQVIKAIINNVKDPTNISLIYANQTEEDILLRAELDAMVAKENERVAKINADKKNINKNDEISEVQPRLSVYYTLDRPGDEWKYGSGFVTYDMINEHLYLPAVDLESGKFVDKSAVVLLCGPLPMIKFACKPNIAKLGYEGNNVFIF